MNIFKQYAAHVISRYRFRKAYQFFESKFNSCNRLFDLSWNNRMPCLNENVSETSFDRHYIYHTAWAARVLSKNIPQFHVDISSSLYFSTMVSAFIPVHFYDYRPAHIELSDLTSSKANLLSLPFADGSVQSLSCMHVVEHVGLGRYGDELDPDGDVKAIGELQRVLAPGGMLFFVVPVGGQARILFNAHRIYRYEQLMDSFKDFDLYESALIPDNAELGELVINPPKELFDAQDYGCGCFCFRKKNM